MLLDQIDALTAQIDQISARVSELIAQIPAARGVDGDGTTGPAADRGPDAAVLPVSAVTVPHRDEELDSTGPSGPFRSS